MQNCISGLDGLLEQFFDMQFYCARCILGMPLVVGDSLRGGDRIFSFFTFFISILQKYMVRKNFCKTIHLA
jgi:hypothetical protein